MSGYDLEEAFRLRAAVFCRELQWVGGREQYKETDVFDGSAIHLGITIEGRTQAYLRIHPTNRLWMSDTVFAHAVPPDCKLHGAGSCEVSRLAVAKPFRRSFRGDTDLSADILQLMLLTCRLYNFQTIYAIVSFSVFKWLQRKGLPFRLQTKVMTATHPDYPLLVKLNLEEFLTTSTISGTAQQSFLAFEEEAVSQIRRPPTVWDKAG